MTRVQYEGLFLKTIAIVGAGFSGVATAINLQRIAEGARQPVRTVLIDSPRTLAGGLAYATNDDNLVLNVPIGNMSAFTDQPDDFLRYCQDIDSALLSGSFACRRIEP